MCLDQAVVYHRLIVGIASGCIGALNVHSHFHPAAPPLPIDQRILEEKRFLQNGVAVAPLVKFIFPEAFVCAEGADLRKPLQDVIAFFTAIPILCFYLELLPCKTIHVKQLIGIAVGHIHRLMKILKIFPWRLHFSYPLSNLCRPGFQDPHRPYNPERQAGVPHRLPFGNLPAPSCGASISMF